MVTVMNMIVAPMERWVIEICTMIGTRMIVTIKAVCGLGLTGMLAVVDDPISKAGRPAFAQWLGVVSHQGFSFKH